jgi:hypothetical protein
MYHPRPPWVENDIPTRSASRAAVEVVSVSNAKSPEVRSFAASWRRSLREPMVTYPCGVVAMSESGAAEGPEPAASEASPASAGADVPGAPGRDVPASSCENFRRSVLNSSSAKSARSFGTSGVRATRSPIDTRTGAAVSMVTSFFER